MGKLCKVPEQYLLKLPGHNKPGMDETISQEKHKSRAVMVYITWETKARLVYRARSRITRVTQKNSISKNQNEE